MKKIFFFFSNPDNFSGESLNEPFSIKKENGLSSMKRAVVEGEKRTVRLVEINRPRNFFSKRGLSGSTVPPEKLPKVPKPLPYLTGEKLSKAIVKIEDGFNLNDLLSGKAKSSYVTRYIAPKNYDYWTNPENPGNENLKTYMNKTFFEFSGYRVTRGRILYSLTIGGIMSFGTYISSCVVVKELVKPVAKKIGETTLKYMLEDGVTIHHIGQFSVQDIEKFSIFFEFLKNNF